MSITTASEALDAVTSTATEVRTMSAALDDARTMRDETIAIALELGVSQVAIAAAAQLSQAAVSRVDRKRAAMAGAL